MKFWTLAIFSLFITSSSFALPDIADTHHFIESVIQPRLEGHGFKINTPGIDSLKGSSLFDNKKFTPKDERTTLENYLSDYQEVLNNRFRVFKVDFTLAHMLTRSYHTGSLYLKVTTLHTENSTHKDIKNFMETSLDQRKFKQHTLIKDHKDPSIVHLVYVAKDVSGAYDCHSVNINDFMSNRTEQEQVCEVKITPKTKELNLVARYKYKKRRALIFNFKNQQKEDFILNALERTLTSNGLSLIPESIKLTAKAAKDQYVDQVSYSYINKSGETQNESLFFIAKKLNEQSAELLDLRHPDQVAHIIRNPSFYHSFKKSEFVFLLSAKLGEEQLNNDLTYKDLIYSDITKLLFKPSFAVDSDFVIKDIKDMSN